MSLKNKLILISYFFLVLTAEAQDINLTVTGVGSTKADAIIDAQRNALRISYGEFISSNISVVNNELVKNENVNLVNGTIKNFKVVSVSENIFTDPPILEVLIDVTTSRERLMAFSKSIGIDVEVAGSLFGAQIKLQKINQKNESIAMEHLLKRVQFANNLFDYKLEVNDPKIYKAKKWKQYNASGGFDPYCYRYQSKTRGWQEDCDVSKFDGYKGTEERYGIDVYSPLFTNDNYLNLRHSIINTLESIQMSEKEKNDYLNINKPYFLIHIMLDKEGDCAYTLNRKIRKAAAHYSSWENAGARKLVDKFCRNDFEKTIYLRSKKSLELLGTINELIYAEINKYKLIRVSGTEKKLIDQPTFREYLNMEQYDEKGNINPFLHTTENGKSWSFGYTGWKSNPFKRISTFVTINTPPGNKVHKAWVDELGVRWEGGLSGNRWNSGMPRPSIVKNNNYIRFYERGHPFAYLYWRDVVTVSELSKVSKYEISIN